MMTGHKPFGIALGFLGNLAIALSLNKLIGTGSCGGDLPACPDSLTGRIILLPAGIILLDEAATALGAPLRIGRGGVREGVVLDLVGNRRGDPAP